MKQLLTRLFAALLIALVIGLCAFAALRLAIHGREVLVPNLAGMSDTQAAQATHELGLNLSVENRFFSAGVSPNHVLSQSPVAGASVRRGLQVRVTESLGAQHLEVPDVIGQTERPAELILKRSQLELNAVVHLPAAGPAGVVLAQTPPPNSAGLNGPQVSLLVSDPESPSAAIGYVMPSLAGLTLSAASSRLATVGLHVANAQEPDLAPPPSEAVEASSAAPQDPAIPPTIVTPPAPPPVSSDAVVIGQNPAPGHRVSRNDAIRLTLAMKTPAVVD